MRCPFCGYEETQVKDSRPSDDNLAIRRRRFCPECIARFTTYERIQLSEITVVKKSGDKVPFDRDKLARSLYMAVRKRPFEKERIEKLINGIVRRLELLGESEISSRIIGEIVMEALQELDMVAYIRFASVYKEFKDVQDFQVFIKA
jgi:transcriptional repressor NrdR